MQYHNADRAVVFQSNNSIDRLLKEAEVRRLETEKARREQEQKDIQMTALVGDAFNDKDYLTGTEYDPFFQKSLQEKRQKYADLIKNNSMDIPTVQQMIQRDMSSIASTSLAVKNFRSGLKEYTKMFDQKSGLIPKNIEVLSMKKFLFKEDGTLKKPEELAGTPDEVAQMILEEHPELIVNEHIAKSSINKAFEDSAYDVKKDETVSKKGTTNKYKLDYRLNPYQELVRDANGQLKIGQDGMPIVKIKSQPTKDKSGAIIGEELSDDVFGSFVSSPQGKALVQAKFKQVNSQLKTVGRTPVEDNTPEAYSIKKEIVRQMLSENKAIRSEFGTADVDAARKQALMGGYLPTPKEPEDKSTEKFENTPTGRLLDLSRNGVNTEGLDEVKIDKDNTGFGVMGIVGAYKSPSGKEYVNIVYNPKDKTFNFIPEFAREGIKKVKAEDMPKMLRGSYKINGIRNEDLDKIDGGSGKTVKESDIPSIAARYVNPATGRKYTTEEYRQALIKANVKITK